jgi:hypothetical protein
VNYQLRIEQTKLEVIEFCERITNLGFPVYLSGSGTHGVFTLPDGSRVVGFEYGNQCSLSGTYGPPSRDSGTGWKLEQLPGDLVTSDDVEKVLNEKAPKWCGNGWKRYTTIKEHLDMYGASSRYISFEKKDE